MRHYHPTKLDTGQLLISYEAKAKGQDGEILTFLQHNYRSSFTAFEIEERFAIKQWPVTSIRRALTNLMQAGLIVEDGTKAGRYGRAVTKYKIK